MKVTVVTPVYNGAETIKDCIESVKMQDYDDIEHLIIDGKSTDSTIDIVKQHNVQYVSEPDAGIYDAFSKGVRLATGDIVHILNSDDMYATPDVISKMVGFIRDNDLDLCHGYVEQINSKNIVVKRIGKESTKEDLLKKVRVAHPSTFIKKNVYQKFGEYSIGFQIAADHEFLLRVWDKINVGFLPIVTTRMRLGGASNSQVKQSYKESLAATLLHGANPLKALVRYYYELLKAKIPRVQPKV